MSLLLPLAPTAVACLLLAFTVVWLLGALLTAKLDAVLSVQPSVYREKLLLALAVWPIVAVLLLTCKHKASNASVQFDY